MDSHSGLCKGSVAKGKLGSCVSTSEGGVVLHQLVLRMELKPSSQLTDKSTTNHTHNSILIILIIVS